jgi:glycosyltransferase involved in cell wall biosynthesis
MRTSRAEPRTSASAVIYVCIPTHNEAATIGVLLWKTRNVIGEFGRDYRIVVHDDASTDGTAEVLQRYRHAVPLTVLRSEKRIGYGRSVEKLLRHVRDEAPYPKRDCAVVMQGDFTESPDDAITLVKIIEGGADIVAGDVSSDEAPDRGVRLVRWATSKFLPRVTSGAPVADPLMGLRAYRVIVLKKALRDRSENDPLIRSDGWAANVELLGALAPHARRIVDSPFELRYDLQARPSRFRPWKTLFGLARLPGSMWAAPDPGTA